MRLFSDDSMLRFRVSTDGTACTQHVAGRTSSHSMLSRGAVEVMVYSLFYSINALYYESDLQAMSWVLLCFSAILPLLAWHSEPSIGSTLLVWYRFRV